MSDRDMLLDSDQQYETDRARRAALERELQELNDESERGRQVLDSLDEKIRSLRSEVERQRRLKPERGCSACRAVTLQVDAAAQSLLGSAGHVARTLLRDPEADRAELLDTVLRYLEPVKHLDPDLEDMYDRAQASLRRSGPEPARPAHYRSIAGGGGIGTPPRSSGGYPLRHGGADVTPRGGGSCTPRGGEGTAPRDRRVAAPRGGGLSGGGLGSSGGLSPLGVGY